MSCWCELGVEEVEGSGECEIHRVQIDRGERQVPSPDLQAMNVLYGLERQNEIDGGMQLFKYQVETPHLY